MYMATETAQTALPACSVVINDIESRNNFDPVMLHKSDPFSGAVKPCGTKCRWTILGHERKKFHLITDRNAGMDGLKRAQTIQIYVSDCLQLAKQSSGTAGSSIYLHRNYDAEDSADVVYIYSQQKVTYICFYLAVLSILYQFSYRNTIEV